MNDAELSRRARALAGALEPLAGQVYFAPECHERYQRLGFGPSLGDFGGVAAPDGPAYFTSRGSVMGQVAGKVVAAAFGVFDPRVVVPAVTHGWSLTDAATICAERTAGAVEQLVRLLGPDPDGTSAARALLTRATDGLRPEGRPLFAGVLSLGLPDVGIGAVWRLADRLREYRGDSHTAAWIAAGLDATEIGLLSELYWGLPMRSYIRTRAWSNHDLDAAEERLVSRGWIADGALTDAGRAAREAIEVATDVQLRPAVTSLGDDLDALLAILTPWAAAIRAGRGYPANGPHDLARAARR